MEKIIIIAVLLLGVMCLGLIIFASTRYILAKLNEKLRLHYTFESTGRIKNIAYILDTFEKIESGQCTLGLKTDCIKSYNSLAGYEDKETKAIYEILERKWKDSFK